MEWIKKFISKPYKQQTKKQKTEQEEGDEAGINTIPCTNKVIKTRMYRYDENESEWIPAPKYQYKSKRWAETTEVVDEEELQNLRLEGGGREIEELKVELKADDIKDLKLITYNIWFGRRSETSKQLSTRINPLIDIVLQEFPHVFCFQEVTQNILYLILENPIIRKHYWLSDNLDYTMGSLFTYPTDYNCIIATRLPSSDLHYVSFPTRLSRNLLYIDIPFLLPSSSPEDNEGKSPKIGLMRVGTVHLESYTNDKPIRLRQLEIAGKSLRSYKYSSSLFNNNNNNINNHNHNNNNHSSNNNNQNNANNKKIQNSINDDDDGDGDNNRSNNSDNDSSSNINNENENNNKQQSNEGGNEGGMMNVDSQCTNSKINNSHNNNIITATSNLEEGDDDVGDDNELLMTSFLMGDFNMVDERELMEVLEYMYRHAGFFDTWFSVFPPKERSDNDNDDDEDCDDDDNNNGGSKGNDGDDNQSGGIWNYEGYTFDKINNKMTAELASGREEKVTQKRIDVILFQNFPIHSSPSDHPHPHPPHHPYITVSPVSSHLLGTKPLFRNLHPSMREEFVPTDDTPVFERYLHYLPSIVYPSDHFGVAANYSLIFTK